MILSENETKFLDAAKKGDLETIQELTISRENEIPLIPLKNHDRIRGGRFGETALLYACRNCHWNVVRFFIENNVNINGMEMYSGATALHVVSNLGHIQMIEYLIGHGANVNQPNHFDWTPLHRASYDGKFDTVHALLVLGADPFMKEVNDKTAVDWAERQGHDHVYNFILQFIRQKKEIRELIPSQYNLPMGIWPYALSRIKSISLIFRLVCEVPHLFQQQEETRK